MKLRRLQLNPFAGTIQRNILFGNGLNVVLGPNEAGKSTMLQALRCLFFVPTNLTQHKFKEQMQKHLPLQGGDTLRVEGDIELEGEDYQIIKSWGGTKGSRLVLPSGADMTEAARVEEEIARKLGFSQAVYDQVLLTRQNQLADTIELLRKERESTLSLSDKLRQSLYELDGISVQALKEETDGQVSEYFGRWDIPRRQPEGGKDIHSPWLKGVGLILKAYYEWRRQEQALQETIAYENSLDAINSQLLALESQLNDVFSFVQQYEPLIADLQKRQELELKLNSLRREKAELAEVADKWPVQQNKLEESRRLKEEKEKQLLKAQEAIKAWREYNRRLDELKLYEEAKALKERYDALREEKAAMPQVTVAPLQEIRKIERETDRLKGMVDAQKLRIAIKPNKAIKLKIALGLNAAEEITLDDLVQYEAGGRVRIDHEDFTLAIASGEMDVQKIKTELKACEDKIQALLSHWQVHTIEDLEGLKAAYEKKQAEEDHLAGQIRNLLKGRKFTELEQSVHGIQKPAFEESQEVLEARAQQLTIEYSEHKSIAAMAAEQLKDWERKYESRDKLFERLVSSTALISEYEKQYAGLKPLPAEISDTESFLTDFQQKKSLSESLKEKKNELEKERLRLEASAPGISSEELQDNVSLAKQQYEKTLRQGEAYLRIQTELNEILEELDKDTFTPLREKTEQYFHRLTGGKYRQLVMNEMVPAGVEVHGAALPAELLSAGTLDLLALATRLAMADFYLPEKDGFIIMDDPLVNLDPERQEMAAQCLQEIAQARQVIILTCHPRHAELLQGDIIRL